MMIPRRRPIGLALACLSLATACSSGNRAKVEQRLELSAIVGLPAQAFGDMDVPELKKVVPQSEPEGPPWAPKSRPWVYPMAVDLGIRADHGGKGQFLAPRAHGKHNGIDFLAPVGTPLLSACDGKAKFAKRGGYGNSVHIVCKLPPELGGSEGLYASLFYAHLDKVSVGERWTDIKAGAKIGTVGKTGNASGPKIKPHLHLEIIVRGSEKEAIAEKHSGVVEKAKTAADRYFDLLGDNCLAPSKFRAKSDGIRRERRTDPFVLLMCASRPKPALEEPKSAELKAAQVKWSASYAAAGFNVDKGPL